MLDAIEPLGWTLELCLILWVWIVFFGCAFIVREKDHVTFDIFYLAAGRRLRRGMALVASAAIVVRHDLGLSADMGLHRLHAHARAPRRSRTPSPATRSA
jgi:hypothetical protein